MLKILLMNTIIIEDENLTAQRLEGMLKKYSPNIRVLATLPSVAESVDWLRKNDAPDLVFMDIHLEDDLCFKIFELAPLSSPVIFTTAYDEYMVKAFKVNSIDYLLKPLNYLELIAALDKYKALKEQYSKPDFNDLLQYIGQRGPEYKTRFMITAGTKIRSIGTAEIAYFYSDEKITFMVTREGQHLPVDFSLDKLTTLLDPKQFFRASRQFLIGFSAIQTVHTHFKGKLKLELVPKSKLDVFVSGDRMTDFKEWLGK
jgi:two-component system LytT family response regulator